MTSKGALNFGLRDGPGLIRFEKLAYEPGRALKLAKMARPTGLLRAGPRPVSTLDHTNSLTLFKFLNFRTLSFCTTRENYSIVFETNDAQVQCFYEYTQVLQLRFRLPLLHIVFTVANAIMHVSRTTIS